MVINRGFTLIELLVVISIISLLSSVVFGAVSSTQIKARNAYTKSTMRQYINALIFFYDSNKRFPDPSPLSNNGDVAYYCIGADFCLPPFGIGRNAKLDNELKSVYAGLPNPMKKALLWDYAGFIIPIAGLEYGCAGVAGSPCKRVTLVWAYEGENHDCLSGIPNDMLTHDGSFPNSNGNTICQITIGLNY